MQSAYSDSCAFRHRHPWSCDCCETLHATGRTHRIPASTAFEARCFDRANTNGLVPKLDCTHAIKEGERWWCLRCCCVRLHSVSQHAFNGQQWPFYAARCSFLSYRLLLSTLAGTCIGPFLCQFTYSSSASIFASPADHLAQAKSSTRSKSPGGCVALSAH